MASDEKQTRDQNKRRAMQISWEVAKAKSAGILTEEQEWDLRLRVSKQISGEK